jgi:hypothetical protein
VLLVHKDHKVIQEPQVQKVIQVLREFKDRPVLLVQLELEEHKGIKELRDKQDKMVVMEQMVRLDHKVQEVRLV